MTKTNEKPRICDILGVEVGESFTVEGANTADGKVIIYHIQPDGRFATEPPNSMRSSFYFVDAINKPEMVIHVASGEMTGLLTGKEKQILSMAREFGAQWASRDNLRGAQDYVVFWRERPMLVNPELCGKEYNYGGLICSIQKRYLPFVHDGALLHIDTLLNS